MILTLAVFTVETILLHVVSNLTRSAEEQEARAYGESVAAAVRLSLDNSLSASKTLEYLYRDRGDLFTERFMAVAAEIMEDNPMITSLYIAPKGVIAAAFPEEVQESTLGFEMLKDPIQGPKAQLALDTGNITVAGPHTLIEGGIGLIIRNPVMQDDEFMGFAIVIVDWELLSESLLNEVQSENSKYKFGVWKDVEDVNDLSDEDDFILRSSSEKIDKGVDVVFEVPNDVWHLSVEPKKGWTGIKGMYAAWITAILILLLIATAVYSLMIFQSRARQLEAARTASKAKTDFLFNMSHDIRTPMNAILGYTELMEHHLDDKEKIETYLRKIHTSGDFLLSLINNVLDMARIESGKAELNEELMDSTIFAEALENVFLNQFEAKNIRYVCELHISYKYVYADITKMRQIFLNQLSNALKYTPEGGTISVLIEEIPCDREGYTMVKSVVKDSGIGMSRDFLPHIFDEFSREKTTTDSGIEGTGLGMPIVKKMVDLMGGTISIESEPGQGTTITTVLPLRKCDEAEAERMEQRKAKSGQASFEGKRVLVAEDNELNAEISMELLSEMGIEAERAVDGVVCVDMVQKADEGYYDLILMDIQMPNMNGYKSAATIRELPGRKGEIPIVAVTANAFEEDRKKALESGMNAHLAKPIVLADLVAILQEYL